MINNEKRRCREQYEKDFDEMFKLDKKGLMTDIDCYVDNLENKINGIDLLYKTEVLKNEALEHNLKDLQQRIDRAIEYIENQIPIVKNEINIPNINTATSELLNYEQLLEILKGDSNGQ